MKNAFILSLIIALGIAGCEKAPPPESKSDAALRKFLKQPRGSLHYDQLDSSPNNPGPVEKRK